ncbi:MAG: permease [Bacillota bacterium]
MNLLRDVVLTVIGYLRADWLVLLLGVMVAAAVNVYVEPEKMKRLLRAKAGLSIPGAVAFGALTPLCACGTMAVMISMFVTAMPWGPVMAFLVSSPLTSPSEYLFEAAFLGPKFATAVALASVILGLSSGFAAHLLETRTRFFKGQLRLAGEQETAATCCGSELAQP